MRFVYNPRLVVTSKIQIEQRKRQLMLLVKLGFRLSMLPYLNKYLPTPLPLTRAITRFRRIAMTVAAGSALVAINATSALAQQPHGEGAAHTGGEASLKIPDL